MYKLILFSLLGVVVLVFETAALTQYCFEYCRYLFFTQRPLAWDPRCDCSSIADFRFLRPPVTDKEAIYKFHGSDIDYEPVATYPVKIVSYLDKPYVTKPILRIPYKQVTTKINIINKNNNTLICKPKSRSNSKTENCTKLSDTIVNNLDSIIDDKIGGKEQKNYTGLVEKDIVKEVTLENGKPLSIDILFRKSLPKSIKPDTVLIKNNLRPSSNNIASINSGGVPFNINESAVLRDKNDQVNDFRKNDTIPFEAQNTFKKETSTSMTETKFIENVASNFPSDKQYSKNPKELNSPYTISENYTNTAFEYNKSKDMSSVLNANGYYDITINATSVPMIPESTDENKDSISTTPSYGNNVQSTTLINKLNRKTYNETDIQPQKVITKEFSNGTVVSSIDGTEDVSNDEFIDTVSNDTQINNTQKDSNNSGSYKPIVTTIIEAANKSDSEVKFGKKKPIIIVSLHFIFGQDYIFDIFGQKPDYKKD